MRYSKNIPLQHIGVFIVIEITILNFRLDILINIDTNYSTLRYYLHNKCVILTPILAGNINIF